MKYLILSLFFFVSFAGANQLNENLSAINQAEMYLIAVFTNGGGGGHKPQNYYDSFQDDIFKQQARFYFMPKWEIEKYGLPNNHRVYAIQSDTLFDLNQAGIHQIAFTNGGGGGHKIQNYFNHFQDDFQMQEAMNEWEKQPLTSQN